MSPLIELRAPDGSTVRCSVADTVGKRFVGLMGRKSLPPGEGVLFVPGGSVHTAFMRFPIDVAFLDIEGTVLKVAARVRSWQFRKAPRRTRFVVELASPSVGITLDQGTRLEPRDGAWSELRRGRLSLARHRDS